RLTAALGHIHKDHRRIVVLKGQRQVVAANPEIHDAHFRRHGRRGQTPRHLAAEGVVAAKEIADTSNENARLHPLSPPWISSSKSVSWGRHSCLPPCRRFSWQTRMSAPRN